MLTGSFELMRRLNRAAVMNALRTQEPISRSELAGLTGLTRPTVSDIVAELIGEGWAVETNEGTNGGARGRRPILLRFNPFAGYAVGVDVGITQVRTVLTNGNGTVIARAAEPLPERAPAAVIHTVARTVRQVTAQVKPSLVAGCGVGMHGLVDPVAGLSRFAPHFGWRDVNVRELLLAEIPFPVTLENDVRAMALGEAWFGAGQGAQSLICFNVGAGIGSGFVMHGRIYRGAGAGAGEVGHTTVLEEGPRCSCGNDGCLETVASGPAIAARAGLPDGRSVYEAALRGDQNAVRVLAEAGRYLGTAVANLVNVLNPEVVTLGGGVMAAGDLIFQPLLETVRRRALPALVQHLRIAPVVFGAEAGAVGAATLVLEHLFTPYEEVPS